MAEIKKTFPLAASLMILKRICRYYGERQKNNRNKGIWTRTITLDSLVSGAFYSMFLVKSSKISHIL